MVRIVIILTLAIFTVACGSNNTTAPDHVYYNDVTVTEINSEKNDLCTVTLRSTRIHNGLYGSRTSRYYNVKVKECPCDSFKVGQKVNIK